MPPALKQRSRGSRAGHRAHGRREGVHCTPARSLQCGGWPRAEARTKAQLNTPMPDCERDVHAGPGASGASARSVEVAPVHPRGAHVSEGRIPYVQPSVLAHLTPPTAKLAASPRPRPRRGVARGAAARPGPRGAARRAAPAACAERAERGTGHESALAAPHGHRPQARGGHEAARVRVRVS